MDATIILAHDPECAKSTAAYEKIVKLGSLTEEDRESAGHSFHYGEPDKGDARLLGLLDTMFWVLRQYVPKLTQAQWCELLTLICSVGVVDPRTTRIMPYGLQDIDTSPEDLAVYHSLQPIQWFVISLVANRIHSVSDRNDVNLCDVIAEFSEEPAECVFADDPDIGKSWILKEITRDGSQFKVHWTFLDGTDACLTVDHSDPNYLSCTGMKCKTTRRLSPRDINLSSFLFSKTLPLLEEILKQQA